MALGASYSIFYILEKLADDDVLQFSFWDVMNVVGIPVVAGVSPILDFHQVNFLCGFADGDDQLEDVFLRNSQLVPKILRVIAASQHAAAVSLLHRCQSDALRRDAQIDIGKGVAGADIRILKDDDVGFRFLSGIRQVALRKASAHLGCFLQDACGGIPVGDKKISAAAGSCRRRTGGHSQSCPSVPWWKLLRFGRIPARCGSL